MQEELDKAREQLRAAAASKKVTFALTPTLAQGPGLLNYSTKGGSYAYRDGAAKLHEDPLELTPETMAHVKQALAVRAMAQGWNDTILKVKQKPGEADSPTWYLLTEDGKVSLEDLKKDAEVYMGTECRQAQDQV